MPRRLPSNVSPRDVSSVDDPLEEEIEDEKVRRNPRRGAAPQSSSLMNLEDEGSDNDNDNDEEDEMSVEEDDDDESLEADEEEEEEGPRRSRRSRSRANSEDEVQASSRRTSARTTKYASSLKEPTASIRDLYQPSTPPSKSRGRRGAPKSPAIRHSTQRRRVRTEVQLSSESESSSSDEEESEAEYSGDEDEEEMKIQRILACKSDTMKNWKKLCDTMNTSEVDYGSRWYQETEQDSEDDFQERFLVKWTGLSYLHCSWETEQDLLDQIDSAKTYLTTFFRKSDHGLLFSADERCDGDYFDPAFTQIDRILEVHPPETGVGLVMDKSSEDFEAGTGRQFLIKWEHTPYSDSSYEFERDLILADVEYEPLIEEFEGRSKKPTKTLLKQDAKQGEEERRRHYKVFGDDSPIGDDEREEKVKAYRKDLEERVFKNGGQLRDYQAEGVAWLMANHSNGRSSILADEMGLGKTIQTAIYIDTVATKLKRRGPFLIVAPLSTIPHWQREFQGWTELNTVVYHGSAKDREIIREFEIAFDEDRPREQIGFNQSFLKKCLPRGKKKSSPVWMAQVVITTPEMLVTDDFSELTSVTWDVLVVDEAHRLKNHSSKLANNLRDDRFRFHQKLLLTGTPIQNNMTELWTLLNTVHGKRFDSLDQFLEDYGDIKSKEKIDELHETIRPYILRRLKEDVEKSVPPKEETLIEVELTVLQKQYYRALYEKNVSFLHRNKRKALDGPSISNLAMQLRKCCNHPFLLKGVEEEVRRADDPTNEGDFLAKSSGKLVLLDKLLPRLQQDGHRILLFSQFKIMLDILEDYLNARQFRFERIDGCITGNKRQQAIDRFQDTSKGDKAPFVMLLSTRAGGVGINLTAADTCIIFDSDWNPQNDLQAQARCHRIGQTKSVKVYRLLSRKSYEMQMFHMSSLKMGLDQAVLQGFESGGSGGNDGNMTKEEVERLLRHGAYDIFNEEKAGTGEAESNDFVQQDIDSILERRSRTVIHENTGSKSNAAGGTFSKASFKAAKTPDASGKKHEDVDIDDPEFWKKMVGEDKMQSDSPNLAGKKRRRKQANYSEKDYERRINARLVGSSDDGDSSSENESRDSDADSSGSEEYSSSADEALESDLGLVEKPPGTSEMFVQRSKRKKKKKQKPERTKWGGSGPLDWERADVEKLFKALQMYGYGNMDWEAFAKKLNLPKRSDYSVAQLKRMSWSMLLYVFREAADEDVIAARRRAARAEQKKREADGQAAVPKNGGVLAQSPEEARDHVQQAEAQLSEQFKKLWNANTSWTTVLVQDAMDYSASNPPRPKDVIKKATAEHKGGSGVSTGNPLCHFVRNIWPSLKSRGWSSEILADGKYAGQTLYTFQGKQYRGPNAVLVAVPSIHPELNATVETVLGAMAAEAAEIERARQLEVASASLGPTSISPQSLSLFLQMYAPLALVADRMKNRRMVLNRKVLNVCSSMRVASLIVRRCDESSDVGVIDQVARSLNVRKTIALPHPSWTAKHDAVLICAIAKHGWIGHDTCCRAITEDSTIRWGPPFDNNDESAKETTKQLSEEEERDQERKLALLKKTAERAATFFNEEYDMIQEMKRFNQNMVVNAYGLHREIDIEADEKNDQDKWVVNDALLRQIIQNGTPQDDDHDESVELPTKKELLRRAKAVLSKSPESVPSAIPQAAAETVPAGPNHPYSVIDQEDRCNILLSEMLRGVLKASHRTKSGSLPKDTRRLLAYAATESLSRVEDVQETNGADSVKAKETKKVAEQVEDMKVYIKGTSRLAKNVLKAMLGEPPLAGKSPADPMYPTRRPMLGITYGEKPHAVGINGDDDAENAKKKKATRRKRPKGCTGDRAVSSAMARASADSDDAHARRFSPPSTDSLELTATETLMLSVICSQGLPVWTDHWNDLIDANDINPELQGPGCIFSISWEGMGVVNEMAAKLWHDTAASKLKQRRKAFKKDFTTEQAINSFEGQKASAKLKSLEMDEKVKRRAAAQAIDYKNDPLKLAKKCIMLLEALRTRMGPVEVKRGGSSKKIKAHLKSENGLGPKVLHWQSQELARWAQALDIANGYGRPLANTAADFMAEIPGYVEDDANGVSAVMDKKMCRSVYSQIAQQSRLRSVLLKTEESEIPKMLETAVRNIRSGNEIWGRPSWWDDGEDRGVVDITLDYELVEGVAEHGYSGFEEMLDSSELFHRYATESNADASELARGHAQERMNQLTRELSACDDTNTAMKLVRERGEVNIVSDGADNADSKSSGVQTGLHSFFASSSQNNNQTQPVRPIIELSDSELSDPEPSPSRDDSSDNSVEIIVGDTSKRSSPEPVSGSAEKKQKTL